MRNFRWLLKPDLYEIAAIEYRNFEYPWTEREFNERLSDKHCSGLVVEEDNQIVGYVVYSFHGPTVEIENLSVKEEYQRRGIGAGIVDLLKSRMEKGGRKNLIAVVCENNLNGHLFFKSQGFRALKVVKDYYDNLEADGYYFKYQVQRLQLTAAA